MILRKHPTATRPAPRGFTLLEMVVGTAIMSVLMVAMGSILLIAGRALPQSQSVTGTTASAAAAADQMASELRYALAVNQRSTTMIEFTVADRNNDGLPETIRYEWSGTAGDPLTRTYNAGTAAQILSVARGNLRSHSGGNLTRLGPALVELLDDVGRPVADDPAAGEEV